MVIEKFNRSELAQKIIQLGIDVTCMHTNFGGHGFSSFRVKSLFQTMDLHDFFEPIFFNFFLIHELYSPWSKRKI